MTPASASSRRTWTTPAPTWRWQSSARAKNRHAAYHLEQAAEKLITAVRIHRGLLPSKSHDLSELIEGAARGGEPRPLANDDPWRARLLPLAWLSEFATTFRYPTPTGKRKPGPAPQQIFGEATKLRELIESARAELLGG